MSESGDTSRDAKSASVQSESKSEQKMESDGDNDRHDQHSSLVYKEMTQKTTDSDSEEDGDDPQSNTNRNAKVDKENDIENRQRPEDVVRSKTAAGPSDKEVEKTTEENIYRSKDSQQLEDSSQSNTSTGAMKDIQKASEPRERTGPYDKEEDRMTKEDIDTSKDSQQQDDSSQSDTSATTKKDIKMDNEPRERTEDVMTPETAAGESDQKEDGMTKKDIETSKDSQQQDDSSQSDTSTITEKEIKIGSEPSKRTEDVMAPNTAAGESDQKEDWMTKKDIETSKDSQQQDDSSQSDTSATTKKEIKIGSEPSKRTEDVMTPKTAAGESDQKEDAMTKENIDTSKDSQQQDDSSQSNTSTITKKDIKMVNEPRGRTADVMTPKTAAGESDQKEDGITKEDIDTSKDSQQQKHSSQSNTSSITEKDIKMGSEYSKRTKEKTEEVKETSTDSQEQDDSSTSPITKKDIKTYNEPRKRTEDVVTPKTAAAESVQKEDGMNKEDVDTFTKSTRTMEDIKRRSEPREKTEENRWWILPVVAIIFAVCVALFNSDSTPPVQKENNVVELFTEKLNKVESSFPNQRPELWRRSRLHISRHLNTASPTEPVSLILTSGHGAERTLGCLAKRLAEAFSTAQNSSVLNIYGKSKSSQDSDQVKLDIDNDLREAFDGEKLAAVIHRFEELPPGSTLIFYRYCDHENAAYKKVLLLFTVMLDAELEITDNITLGSVEDMVHDQIKRKFVSSDKSALFNQMDVDKLSGLWSRISHLILPVAAEEESIQQGCGLE